MQAYNQIQSQRKGKRQVSGHMKAANCVQYDIVRRTVVGVDATGTPALTEDAERRIFTRSGEIAELPDSLIILQGVSADGSLLLFPGTPDGLVLIDDAGEQVASWPLGFSELRIESGLIVIGGESGTSVLLPGEV